MSWVLPPFTPRGGLPLPGLQARWERQRQSPQGRYISQEELFQRHGFIKRTEPPKPTLARPTSCYPEEWYHRNVWGLKP